MQVEKDGTNIDIGDMEQASFITSGSSPGKADLNEQKASTGQKHRSIINVHKERAFYRPETFVRPMNAPYISPTSTEKWKIKQEGNGEKEDFAGIKKENTSVDTMHPEKALESAEVDPSPELELKDQRISSGYQGRNSTGNIHERAFHSDSGFIHKHRAFHRPDNFVRPMNAPYVGQTNARKWKVKREWTVGEDKTKGEKEVESCLGDVTDKSHGATEVSSAEVELKELETLVENRRSSTGSIEAGTFIKAPCDIHKKRAFCRPEGFLRPMDAPYMSSVNPSPSKCRDKLLKAEESNDAKIGEGICDGSRVSDAVAETSSVEVDWKELESSAGSITKEIEHQILMSGVDTHKQRAFCRPDTFLRPMDAHYASPAVSQQTFKNDRAVKDNKGTTENGESLEREKMSSDGYENPGKSNEAAEPISIDSEVTEPESKIEYRRSSTGNIDERKTGGCFGNIHKERAFYRPDTFLRPMDAPYESPRSARKWKPREDSDGVETEKANSTEDMNKMQTNSPRKSDGASDSSEYRRSSTGCIEKPTYNNSSPPESHKFRAFHRPDTFVRPMNAPYESPPISRKWRVKREWTIETEADEAVQDHSETSEFAAANLSDEASSSKSPLRKSQNAEMMQSLHRISETIFTTNELATPKSSIESLSGHSPLRKTQNAEMIQSLHQNARKTLLETLRVSAWDALQGMECKRTGSPLRNTGDKQNPVIHNIALLCDLSAKDSKHSNRTSATDEDITTTSDHDPDESLSSMIPSQGSSHNLSNGKQSFRAVTDLMKEATSSDGREKRAECNEALPSKQVDVKKAPTKLWWQE